MAVTTLKYLGGIGQSLAGLATDNSQFDALQYKGDYRIDDINDIPKELNSQTSAFYKVLNMFNQGPDTTQPAYQWVRSDVANVLTHVTEDAAADATSIKVLDGSIFQPGMMMINQRTQEIITMSRELMTSLSEINVTGGRGFLGTEAKPLVVGDVLVAMGTALAEKGTATEGNAQLPVFAGNYVSFFATKVSVTELQSNTDMKYGINFPTQVRDAWFKLNRQVSYAMMHSRKGYRDTAAGREYYMDGFMPQIKTNVLDVSTVDGVLTEPVLNDWLRGVAKPAAGSAKRTLFCGELLFNAINMISYNKVQPVVYEDKLLGTKIMSINTSQGLIVDVVFDPWIFPEQDAGSGAMIDMNHVRKRQMRGMPFQVRENIQANDAHARVDEIYGSASVEVDHEECHGIIKGAKGGY